MLASLLATFTRPRFLITLAGVLALATVIWFFGPYLSIGGWAPLAGTQERIAAILTVVLGFVLIVVLRRYLAHRANQRMIRGLLDQNALEGLATDAGSAEMEVLRERFEQALKVLRELEIHDSTGERRYIAELPWYVIIGPPGAGKTTILRNSGLQFPLADRLGGESVQGAAGTRYCDWWFTDEAVLIDTAGRYSTQDVNAEQDRRAWRSFLDLLIEHRRRRPLNGVLLAIALTDIIGPDEGMRQRHIQAVRARLQELMKAFGLRLPVYLLITKVDLVPGFNEFFDDLDESAREQVWGITLPIEQGDRDLHRAFTTAFEDLSRRVEAHTPDRLHDERDPIRRGRLYVFGREFMQLRPAVASFVNEVFRSGRYEMVPVVRGVYLTSGTQEGTPADRLLGAFSRSFGLGTQVAVPFSGRGKAFFIHRLLKNVVFEEQGLVGRNLKLERRLAIMQGATYLGLIALVAVLAVLWLGAYADSSMRLSDTAAATTVVEREIAASRNIRSIESLMPLLDAAAGLPKLNASGLWTSLVGGFGLSVEGSLAAPSAAAYDRVLIGTLLPAFADRLQSRMVIVAAAAGPSELGGLRDLLQSYLMLADRQNFSRSVVAAAARREAELVFPLDAARQRRLRDHFDRLVQLLPATYPLDERAIERARQRLRRVPAAQQIYQRLVRDGLANPALPPFDLLPTVAPGGLDLADPNRTTAVLRVPGLFTKRGFYEFVLPRLPELVREGQGTDWVLGASRIDDAAFQGIARQVVDLYVADYVSRWQTLLRQLGVPPFADLGQAQAVLQTLAAPSSPITQLVEAIRENTTLPPPGKEDQPADPAAAAAAAAGTRPTRQGAATLVKEVAASALSGPDDLDRLFPDRSWPGSRIGEPFKAVTQLAVAANGQPAGLQRMQELYANLFNVVAGIQASPDPTAAALQAALLRIKSPGSDALSLIRTDSALRPEPIRSIQRSITANAWSLILRLAHQNVNAAWQREVLPVCQNTLANRFPFARDATDDVALADFGEVFKKGGVIDAFFDKYLNQLLVNQRGRYVPAVIDGQSLPFQESSLAQFRVAQQIQQTFFAEGGQAPLVKFSIQPTFLDSRAFRSTLAVDDKEIVYRQEPVRAYDLQWPNRLDSSLVSLSIQLTDGTILRDERKGQWAFFRLLQAARLSARGSLDRFAVEIVGRDNVRATYEIKASRATNAFNFPVLFGFRCPDVL